MLLRIKNDTNNDFVLRFVNVNFAHQYALFESCQLLRYIHCIIEVHVLQYKIVYDLLKQSLTYMVMDGFEYFMLPCKTSTCDMVTI